MKQVFLLFLACLAIVVAEAQPTPKEEIKNNVFLSASNGLAYPGPAQVKLTPAPKGKKPFYLSHYGRHGSRYQTSVRDYNYVLETLQKGNERGKLTALGKEVLRRVELMNDDADERQGDLTDLGIRQQKDIAHRMMERFPELFKGAAVVDAHSTMVLRCVFSMENALHQMLSENPKLCITHNATRQDMHYLNYIDRELNTASASKEVRDAYDRYCREHACWQRPTERLFNDTAYYRWQVNGERLSYYLFRMAGSIQNTGLRDQVTLYDLFTDDEIYKNWQMENAYWFLGYGFTSLNGGCQPFVQRRLLRRIVDQADSCLALPRPGVQLRYGHETCLLPLVCLMNINHFGETIDDLNQLEQRGWVNYRAFPMAANVQLVFYRHDPSDKDVLVKVLLNEIEATLPLPTDSAPYYRWADVRAYFLNKLDAYKENN